MDAGYTYAAGGRNKKGRHAWEAEVAQAKAVGGLNCWHQQGPAWGEEVGGRPYVVLWAHAVMGVHRWPLKQEHLRHMLAAAVGREFID